MAGVLAGVVAAGAGLQLTGTVLHAQQQFELFVAAVEEETNRPAVDLTASDIIMTESGTQGRVVRIERFSMPVKLTVLVDNGAGTADSLVHMRSGLRSLLEGLPGDMEVGVIALSPNPRWLARPTNDRAQLLRSVQLLTPDQFPARFSDALVEYTTRLDRERRAETTADQPYMPVLLALSTTGLDGSQVRRDDLRDMLESLVKHGVRTYFAMLSQRGEDPALSIAEGSQIFVARAVQDLTRGQYAALAASSRIATLLPEWGEQIGLVHRVGTNQYRVTLERPATASGPLTELAMFVNREGYVGVVTADGRIP